jgi:hypothetical protein
MVDSQIYSELIKQLDHLPIVQQRRVLEYARSLLSSPTTPRGIPGKELLRFAGTISKEDGQAMMDAIEEECERVDADEW